MKMYEFRLKLHWLGDKPLSEPMMVNLLTHICVSRPKWVNTWNGHSKIIPTFGIRFWIWFWVWKRPTLILIIDTGYKVLTRKTHPTSRPHRWALGCLFFLFLGSMKYTVLWRHCNRTEILFVCLFAQRCTCCTPRTYNFIVLAMYHLDWLMLCY